MNNRFKHEWFHKMVRFHVRIITFPLLEIRFEEAPCTPEIMMSIGDKQKCSQHSVCNILYTEKLSFRYISPGV